MSLFVVDASVVIKWFLDEEHSSEARELLGKGHTFSSPDLLPLEAGNVLWKRIRRKDLTPEQGQRYLRQIVSSPIHLHESLPIIHTAFQLADVCNITVYDGIYLTLAIISRCELVTADKKLRNRLQDTPYIKHIRWIETVSSKL